MGSYQPIADYYSQRATLYGASPLGVDWSCIATQQMRFVQLLKICDFSQPVSVNDLGCGYAALRSFIDQSVPAVSVDYLGIDVSAEMIRLARAELARFAGSDAVMGSSSPRMADYSVASGTFNVAIDHERDEWTAMTETALRDMVSTSRRGSAVNFLADRGGKAVPGLYRTAPGHWADFCRQVLGADVEVIAGYGMDEFTLLLR